MRFPIAVDIKNDSAGNGILLGRVAHDKTIADENKEGRIQSQLRDRLLTGAKRFVLKQNYLGGRARRAVMQMNRCPRFERSRSLKARGFAQNDIEYRAWLETGNRNDI